MMKTEIIRGIVLPATLFLAVTILGVSMANAVVRHYAEYALENMAADIYTKDQEIRTTVEEIFQEYGIQVPDEESRRIGKDHNRHSILADEQRMAIREKFAEMRRAGASMKEVRTTVEQMLKGYGIKVPDERPHRVKREYPEVRARSNRGVHRTLENKD